MTTETATQKPYPHPIYNHQDLIAASRWFGSHFFDADTMRFFKSRLIGCTYTVPGGVCVFITSEKYGSAARHYKVHTFNTLTGDLDTLRETVAEGEYAPSAHFAKLPQARKAWKAEAERINQDPDISARVQAWVAQREEERQAQDKAFQERLDRRQAMIDKHNELMELVRKIEQA